LFFEGREQLIHRTGTFEKPMRKHHFFWATLIVALCNMLPLTAIAQEPDCGKAATTAEQYQCANNELSTAERNLDSAFADALQRYTPNADDNDLPQPQRDQHAQYEKKMRQDLDLSQKIWLQYQSAACAAVSDMYESGTMGPTSAALCKAQLAKQRTEFLQNNFGQVR